MWRIVDLRKTLRHFRRMMRDEAGQALVEYLLITALVVLGSYGLMWVLSDMLVKYYNEIAAYVCLPVP